MKSSAHSLFKSSFRYLREYGFRDTIERGLCKVTATLLRSGFRKRDVPMLGELASLSQTIETNPEVLLQKMLPSNNGSLAELRREYEACARELKRRYDLAPLQYEASFGIEDGSAFLTYALVRMLKPRIVLETGVANGHSSSIILSALNRNITGRLYSVDVSENVGLLVSMELKPRWQLHVLSHGLKKGFAQVLKSLPPIDLMIHDSDHSYQWMRHELEAVFPKMAKDGVMLCDDAHICYGMIDFCRARNLKPYSLIDKRKVFGVIALAAEDPSNTQSAMQSMLTVEE